MLDFLIDARYPYRLNCYYKYAPSCDVTFPYFVICAAFEVVDTPIFPRKRSVVVSISTVFPMSREARPVQFRRVYPYSLLLLPSVVNYQGSS